MKKFTIDVTSFIVGIILTLFLLYISGYLLSDGESIKYWRSLQEDTASTWSGYNECLFAESDKNSDLKLFEISQTCKCIEWGSNWCK